MPGVALADILITAAISAVVAALVIPVGRKLLGNAEGAFLFRPSGSQGIVNLVMSALGYDSAESSQEPSLRQALRRSMEERREAEEALRRSEDRFRALVNHSPTKIHIKDVDGRYILVNREAEKLFGVTAHEARGKTTSELFPEKTADRFVEHDRMVMQSGKPVQQEEVWETESGQQTYLTVKFPIRDARGTITGVGAVGTDITPLKRAEAALILAKEAAEEANRGKSQFLAGMSHELRTPLNAIIGFSEIMMRTKPGEMDVAKYAEFAADIHRSGRHLLDLINDLLDLAKIESGQADLREEAIVVGKAVTACVDQMREQAEKREVVLETAVDADLPRLKADARKLHQILHNLLSNAVKFTPPGGRVSLSVRCDGADGYVFEVSDTGIGIKPEEIPHILTTFGQLDAEFNRRYEGAGLGLPLTKALVEMHGGTLELESSPGAGTTAIARLPASRIIPRSTPSA